MGEINSTNTDIFLFNVAKGGYLSNEQYKILEAIKDGWAKSGKFESRILSFKIPNVLIVFANRELDRKELSQDRWIVLKISTDLTEMRDITDDKCRVKRKKMVKENEESEESGGMSDCD